MNLFTNELLKIIKIADRILQSCCYKYVFYLLTRRPLDSHISEKEGTFSFCSSPHSSFSLIAPNKYKLTFHNLVLSWTFLPWMHGNCNSISAIFREQVIVQFHWPQVQLFPASRAVTQTVSLSYHNSHYYLYYRNVQPRMGLITFQAENRIP